MNDKINPAILNHFNILGMKVTDKVTGFKGVASSISFDLYGCIQVAITPEVDKEGKYPEGRWFDITRLKIKSGTLVMELPRYDVGYVASGAKGAAEKPPIIK